MDTAARKRDERIAKLRDLDLLERLLADDELTADERLAFQGMHAHVMDPRTRRTRIMGLRPKQRTWAEEVARRVFPIDARDVPPGAEVPTPAVLQNLPKRPPGK